MNNSDNQVQPGFFSAVGAIFRSVFYLADSGERAARTLNREVTLWEEKHEASYASRLEQTRSEAQAQLAASQAALKALPKSK